ncbi:hypothetical protein [Novosphingobium sp.]|uniref:hypothetical protein n=1 Tax=Novosphingobium sp. TaxID=1874826 RepID=UPI0025E12355|nr:hypothetical protein [Novosphingobium sp.]
MRLLWIPLTVRAASVALTKSASVINRFRNGQPIPGAIITYRIDAAVSGSAHSQDLSVSDNIPTGTTYQAGSLRSMAMRSATPRTRTRAVHRQTGSPSSLERSPAGFPAASPSK